MLEGFKDRPVSINDTIETEHLTSIRLYKALSQKWGPHTLLAISLRELTRPGALKNKDLLNRVQTYLLAQRSQVGPGNADVLPDLEMLLAVVERELASIAKLDR